MNDAASWSGPSWQWLAGLCGFTLAYIGGAELGHWLSAAAPMATCWPPLGLLLAVLLRCPRRAWPALGLTALAANMSSDVLLHGQAPLVSLGFSAANIFDAFIAAWLLVRCFGTPFHLDRLNAVLGLAGTTALVSGVLGANLGAAIISFDFGAAFGSTWLMWWTADLIGIWLVTPLLLTLWPGKPPLQRPPPNILRALEGLALLVGLTGISLLIFWGHYPFLSLPFFFLPFLLWAALRFGLLGVAVALPVLALTGLKATVAGHGPFVAVGLPLNQSIVLVQLFISICALCFLALAAVMAERRQALEVAHAANAVLEQRVQERTAALQASTEALQASARRTAMILDSMTDVFYAVDHQWRFTLVNRRAERLYGRLKEELLGRELWAVAPQVVGTAFAREYHRAMTERCELRFEMESVLQPDTWFLVHGYPTEDGLAIFGTDITARRQAEEALKAADQRKDEFLAMLAHELRNPLAPIRNATRILHLLGPAEPKLQWALEVIERQTGHLTRLVDDLLDVARLLQGKIILQKAPVELATIIAHAVETSRPLIEARRQTLAVTLPPQPVRLDGDLTRLAQVLANLLNNAAKYTGEGGRIGLEAEVQAGEVAIRVWDTGAGIPAELLPQVFDLFTQAERTLDRTQGGLGVGLTVVKSLVALHGGTVEARSAGPGRGSEFIVHLPVPAMPAGAAETGGGEAAPVSGEQPLRILVVDDNVDAADSVAILLRLQGHEVRTVYSGAAALALASEFQPQVVLLDLGLPEMDGYAVAQRLRTDPVTRTARLVALTGYGQPEDLAKSHAAGFDAHLTKPVDADLLFQAVGASAPATGAAFQVN